MAGIASEAFATWTVHGLTCAMSFGGRCVNGYVQLPESLRSWWTHYDEMGPAFTPMELTHGPDAEGWVGFFGGSAGEVWDVADLEAALPAFYGVELMYMQRDQDETREALGPDWTPRRVWTLAAMRAEVERLAANLARVAWEIENPGYPIE